MPGLCDHLGDGEGGAQDGVITGKSAVGAVVDAFVGYVERRVEADGFAEVLAGEVPATHGHGFQLGPRLWRNKLFKFPEKRRYFLSIECVHKAHAASFMCDVLNLQALEGENFAILMTVVLFNTRFQASGMSGALQRPSGR